MVTISNQYDYIKPTIKYQTELSKKSLRKLHGYMKHLKKSHSTILQLKIVIVTKIVYNKLFNEYIKHSNHG